MSSMPPLKFLGRVSLVTYGLLGAIAVGTVTPILPKISDEFLHGSNGVYIKMVATAFGLGMLFGSPLGGLLADRFGRKVVMLGSTLLFALAGCSIFFSTTLWPVIVARFFVGIALGGLGTAVVAAIGDYFGERDRGRWLGYVTAAGAIGVLPIYPLVGYIADIGWRNTFLLYAISLLAFACIMVGIPSTRRPSAIESEAAGIAQTGAAKLRYRFPWAVFCISLAIGVISTGTSLYISFRLREIGLTSTKQISLYLLPSVFIGGLTAFFYGYFRRYMSVETVFMAAALASCIGLVIAALAPYPALVTLGMMIEAFGVGVLVPNSSMYALAVSAAEYRARTVGLAKGALFGSPFAAQFVLERISQKGGPSAALLAIAAVGASIALTFALRRFGSKNKGGETQLSPGS